MKIIEQNMPELWYHYKRCNVHKMEIPSRGERVRGIRKRKGGKTEGERRREREGEKGGGGRGGGRKREERGRKEILEANNNF